jgi:hypothetical protein
MSIIITQDTLNYIFKTDASKLEHIMGEGYDRKWVSGNDKDLYYVIQDTTTEENNTTGKNVAVCKPTTFKIDKYKQ